MNEQQYIPKVGEFFTVVRWTSHTDNSYRGDCLEAVAVDGPLVRCRRHPQPDYIGRFTVSAEELIMRPLSAEFVSSVVTNQK